MIIRNDLTTQNDTHLVIEHAATGKMIDEEGRTIYS
jgi:hypothetical protein